MRKLDSGPADELDAYAVDGEEAFDWREYLEVVRRRWRVIAVVAAICLAIAIVHFIITPNRYRATTTLQIEQRSAVAMTSDPNPWLEAWIGMKYYPTQYRLLESRGLAERVVVDLRLMDDATFNPGRARLAAGGSSAPGTAAADEAALARLANRLLAGLTVDPVKDTELVRLAWVGSDPELVARVANGFADAFIDWGIETRSESVGRASDFLSKQIDTLKEEISQKERQLQQYGRSTDILDLEPSSNVTLQRLERLNQDYIAALGDRLEKEARYNERRRAPADSLADRESGGLVGELQREQLRLESDYETKLRTYKPDWPEMVELAARIDEGRSHLERLIEEQTDKAISSAFTDYQTALRREQSLEDEIARVKAEVMDQNVAAVEFRNLEMEIRNRRELMDEMLRRLSEAGVRARLQSERETNVRVIDRALVPDRPFRPSLRRDLFLGIAAGLAFGIGLVLLTHFLDRTVKSADELEQRLQLPVLATIPDTAYRSTARGYGYYRQRTVASEPTSSGPVARLRAVARLGGRPTDAGPAIELLPQTRPQSAVSEAYRSLRTGLLLSSADELRVVLVTSPDSGDGKTATAANLAVVMAQLGYRTLLLDADLRKPRLHRIFGRSNRAGLVNVLAGGGEAESHFVATDLPQLYLCPSGPHPPNPSELLSSQRMVDLLGLVRTRFDFVVVDSPPALVVTDAIVTGSMCDGVVLCCQAHKTLREDAQDCVDRLVLADVKVLGAVLNRYRPTSGGSYGRRYYYEAYGEAEETAAELANEPAADSAA